MELLKDGTITKLDPEEMQGMVFQLCTTARTCLDVPYDRDTTGGKEYWRGHPYRKTEKGWVLDFVSKPPTLDCSGFLKFIFGANKLYLPDGANSQYEYCHSVPELKPGDLLFAKARNGFKDHVGFYLGDGHVIEARAHQNNCSFETGKVIIRPLERWQAWERYAGFRRHPLLT